jgi:hypothetical protein
MSSAPYTANIASRIGRTELVKFLQSFRSSEYSHLHNSYSSFITDINRSGEDYAWGDRHGLSVHCGGNSRLSAVWKICAMPYLLASHSNWTYLRFHTFAAVQFVRLLLWDVESFQWIICARYKNVVALQGSDCPSTINSGQFYLWRWDNLTLETSGINHSLMWGHNQEDGDVN